MKNKIPKVSVCMITYGHENFIEKAINSVLMQECNFEIELIVANDCSLDNTTEIVKHYIETHPRVRWVKYTLHSKNKGMIHNFIWALQQCNGNYIALCEGDDYWTDPLKLQKQVDFLEENYDYSICWTKYKISQNNFHNSPDWVSVMTDFTRNINFDNFSSPYCTHTLTSVFRRDSLNMELVYKFKYFKDNSLYCLCLQNGKGAVLNFFGGIYRVHNKGIYSSASDYNKAISNYTNYEEILQLIPESRVPNIIKKRNDWKSQFLKELYKRPISKINKWIVRGKLHIYFKYLSIKN